MQLIGRVYVMAVLAVALEHHQILVVEDKVGPLVESGEYLQSLIQLPSKSAGFRVAGRSPLAKVDQSQHLFGQCIANTSDCTDGAAADKSVEDLGIDTDHQSQLGVAAGDVLGRVGERLCTAEFFEAHEVGIVTT